MNQLLEYIIQRTRTLSLILVFLIIAGIYSFIHMPKESEPDVKIPVIYVSMTHKGISPEDAERMLIRPMEKELQSIEGVKQMTANAGVGQASVSLEFEAGFNSQKALADVREKVDIAAPELPEDTDEPVVNEVSFAMFPMLIVGLAGEIPERTLLKIADDLKDQIETIPAILEATIAGDRDELLEVVVNPEAFETYDLNFSDVFNFVKENNKLVAAGTLDVGRGRIPVKVPGLFESAEDIYNTPIKTHQGRVVKFGDVAQLRLGFTDRTSYARIAGKPAIALEIKKRAGENSIQTVEAVRAIVEKEKLNWPDGIHVDFFQDKSQQVKDMLKDLGNNLISAIVLVMVIVVVSLGFRTGALVGIAIPGSFLAGVFFLNIMGYTINIVVLFSLILVVGMLVDGAIVVTEIADRKMTEGANRKDAYILASQRMFLPIFSSTLTTLAAFMPLLFWPGLVGEFMKFLPITLIATLTASLFMALIFVPSLGRIIGKPSSVSEAALNKLSASESGNLDNLGGFTGWYLKHLKSLLKHPLLIFFSACIALLSVYFLYAVFGKGLEFFPDVEPERVTFNMRVRGNYSIEEYDALLKNVESRILDMKEFSTIYSTSIADGGSNSNGQGSTEDTHGTLFIEFVDWTKRRKANEILAEVKGRLHSIPGIIVELRAEEAGPPVGKPITILLSSDFPNLLEIETEKISQKYLSMSGLKDIEDSRPVPGIEWRIHVDREEASKYNTNIRSAGDIIQLITNGLKIDDYRPTGSDDEVDIRVRYPEDYRNLDKIDELRVPTSLGMVPLGNFISQTPAQKVSRIERTSGKRSNLVRADVQTDILPADKVKELEQWIKSDANIDPRVTVEFKGEDEEQRKAQAFLMEAFFIALSVMAIILVTQFNSFYNAFLILTAVVFSTVGVFLGLLLTHQPFGIVMNGIGVISLAGIVVNNNIVLIDTFIRLKKTASSTIDAVLRTCAQRLRPVLLTTITTILGLLPMVLKLNIDFIDRTVNIGAPSTQWWSQLATSVAFGLAFATLLTLVLTPAMLVLGDQLTHLPKRLLKR